MKETDDANALQVQKKLIDGVLTALALCAAVITLATLGGCATIQEVRRPSGKTEYLIACGAGTGWNICYNKANEVCPPGYTTLSEDAGFNRKELRIECD